VSARFSDIDKRFGDIDKRFGDIDKRFGDIDKRFDNMQAEMRDGFAHVNHQLNQAKVRDEELHRLMKFGLEAREALRETMDARFDAADRKHDEQIGLLKDVLRDVTRN
jgi:hypothetical protein